MRTQNNKKQTAWSVVEARENTSDPVWIEILKDGASIPDQSRNKVEQNPYKPGVLSLPDWNVTSIYQLTVQPSSDKFVSVAFFAE